MVILTASHQKHPDYLLVFQRSNCFVIWDTRLSVPRDRRDLTFDGKHQKARSGEKKEYVGVNVWYVKDNKNTVKTEQTNLHAAHNLRSLTSLHE